MSVVHPHQQLPKRLTFRVLNGLNQKSRLEISSPRIRKRVSLQPLGLSYSRNLQLHLPDMPLRTWSNITFKEQTGVFLQNDGWIWSLKTRAVCWIQRSSTMVAVSPSDPAAHVRLCRPGEGKGQPQPLARKGLQVRFGSWTNREASALIHTEHDDEIHMPTMGPTKIWVYRLCIKTIAYRMETKFQTLHPLTSTQQYLKSWAIVFFIILSPDCATW